MDLRIYIILLFFVNFSEAFNAKTIWELIQYNNTLRKASNYTVYNHLSSYFERDNITVFMPTDRAFHSFDAPTYGYNMSSIATVQNLFLYHMIDRKMHYNDFRDNTTAVSLHPNGAKLYFNVFMDGKNKIVSVNGAVLIGTDIIGSNGVLHIIDRVIAPITSTKTIHDYLLKPDMPNLVFKSIAMASIIDMDLKESTNKSHKSYTVFAPNDSHLIYNMPEYAKDIIFDPSNLDLLKKVFHAHTLPYYNQFIPSKGDIPTRMSYNSAARIHIYQDKGQLYVMCNRTRAKVIRPNIPVLNGVIHVIDNLMCFLYMNINQTLQSMVETSSFVSYLRKMDAGFLEKLKLTNHTYTVFASVDEAFAKLPLQQQENLNNDANNRDKTFKGHIIPDLNVDVENLGHGMVYSTLGTSSISVINKDGEIYIENGGVRAKVLRRNVGATNGVIHLISSVLLTKDFTILDAINGNSQLKEMATYISRHTDLKQLLSSNTRTLTVFLPGLLAMSNIPSYTKDTFDNDPVLIYEAIRGHIIEGVGLSSDSINQEVVQTTVSGKKLIIAGTVEGFELFGSDIRAETVVTDIYCSNGVLHIIDNLLHIPTRNIYDEAQQHSDLRIITNFLSIHTMSNLRTSLQSSDNKYTVFLPSDKTFNDMPRSRADMILRNTELLKKILESHIVPSVNVLEEDFIDGQWYRAMEESVHIIKNNSEVYLENNNVKSKLIRGNIRATNGVMHVIDRLLYYPYYTVAEVMCEQPEFRPFYKMLSKNEEFLKMTESIQSPVTIFAPSMKYLNSLPTEKLQMIEADPELLKQIYKGHVIPNTRLDSKFLNQHVTDSYSVTSSLNTNFRFTNSSEGLQVDAGFDNLKYNLDVVRKGTACSNGIVYEIDGFLSHSFRSVYDEMRYHTLLKYSLDQFIKLLPSNAQEVFRDGSSKLTVFIPYDKAVQYLSQLDIKYLNENLNETERTQLFDRHIVNGSIMKYNDLSTQPTLPEEMEQQDVELVIKQYAKFLKWKDIYSEIFKSDIIGSNGIVHIVDRYLFKAPDKGPDEITTVLTTKQGSSGISKASRLSGTNFMLSLILLLFSCTLKVYHT